MSLEWEREVRESYVAIPKIAKRHGLSERTLTREYRVALTLLVCTHGHDATAERRLFGELYAKWVGRS